MSLLRWRCPMLLTAAALVGCGGEDAFFGESATTGAGASTSSEASSGGASAGGSSTGGSGGSGSAAGGGGSGSGGAGASGGQGGGPSTACGAATRAAGASSVLLWSTLDDPASITSPVSGDGSGAGTSTMPVDDYAPALSASGIVIDATGEWARWRQSAANIQLAQGTIDFCYQPAADQSTDQNFALFGLNIPTTLTPNPAFIRLRKAAADNGNSLQFLISDGTTFAEWAVPTASYTLTAGTFHRITVSWSTTSGGLASEAHLYIDGVELVVPNPPAAVLVMPPADPNVPLYLGAFSAGNSPGWYGNGVFDELVIHDVPIVP